MSEIVYFSKMFQSVPHLAQVESLLPGVFVSNRLSTLRAIHAHYPQIGTSLYSRLFGFFAKGNALLKQARLIVTGSPYKSFLAPYKAKKCTVFHGTYMLLSKEALRRNGHFDLLCVIGPRMQGMIDRFGDEITVRTAPTGFLPFCEYPDRNEARRGATLSLLGLDPAKRTIIYTPSRRGIGSWNLLAERLVQVAPPHFNLVLRPHPSQALTSRRADRANFRKIQGLLKNRGHALLDLTSVALPTLFSVADLLVSDANSPTEESLFYDIPQLLVESPHASRIQLREQATREGAHIDDIEKLLTLYECGPIFDTASGDLVESMLDRAIDDAGRFASQRENYFSWVFGQRDRQANQRVAAAIRDHLLN